MTGRRLHLVGAVPDPRPLLREVLGARLRRARTAQARSLRDVAEAAGVSMGHLSQVERGLAEASSEVLRAVCRALGVPQAALLRAAAHDLAVHDLTSPDVGSADLAVHGGATPAPGAVQAAA